MHLDVGRRAAAGCPHQNRISGPPTEIAPHCAWNWCWYGKAAEAIGEVAEACKAYREALRLEQIEAIKTDALDRLASLESPW